ncbi:acyltransferase family protein [Crateriforma conspicua]|uniref:DUF5009 domain-containing protein n=1 Tax=Crateriforma conspicua TaxID=2527996 RepID=A0A5C5Y4Z6_9PLAN|nr:DUF5009 domain-containing protein [Crateriforma conspicua]TWT69969.1 hypothetical protein Pan14r_22660 [Crateriforma conspicua]
MNTPSDDSRGDVPNEPALTATKTGRVVSIDVFRGMVMFLMLAEMMHLDQLGDHFPDSTICQWISFHTSHIAWEGGSLHDMIQPGFTFLVGVALPFSIASRRRRGSSDTKLFLHALWRAAVLVLLGIGLRSLGHDSTQFRFDDTLTQIGLGYPIAFVICLLSPRWNVIALAVVLIGFWTWYAASAPPPDDFDYAAVGVPQDWPHHHDGFASRWNKNSNPSWRLEVWWMNLFPREEPFVCNGGGYCTISFIPTLGTMLLGIFAGRWFRDIRSFGGRMRRLLLAASICFVLGWFLGWTDLCPIVKRIWTPSWTLVSGAVCFLWLALLHWICDQHKWQSWSFPFVVIGANSILAYVFSWTIVEPIRDVLFCHLGRDSFAWFGPASISTVSGAITLLIIFGMLLWLYQRRVFIKI